MVSIGDFTYCDCSPEVQFQADADLVVGKYCSIARGFKVFLGGNHRVDWISTFPFPVMFPGSPDIPGHRATKGNVVIGNDVWIGNCVTILSGVTIGDGAVIGAGSVVVKDIPPYSISAGNPCIVRKYRFTPDQIRLLCEIKWWNWPNEKVKEAIPLLMSGGIEEFIRKYH